jgi:peptide/nickel transport system ATP-binding protein
MTAPLLQVEGLTVTLDDGTPIVEDASFSVSGGEARAIVGESGSGKTTVALALLCFARPGATIAAGRVRVGARELTALDEAQLRSVRGREISYVPQDPATSLNPSFRVEDQVAEVLRAHRMLAPERILDVLDRVHLPTDRPFRRRFPHQLSGGQQQRLAIAMALACDPRVIVLDEPTTGLDVITQARILTEIARLRREQGLALVYVTHDLAVVSAVATDIAVMYAGRVVEAGPADVVLTRPEHPYTRGLIASVPDHVRPKDLAGIRGIVPDIRARPPGCAFAARCTSATGICTEEIPRLEPDEGRHRVACFHPAAGAIAGVPRLTAARPGTPPCLGVEGLTAEHPGKPPVVAAAGVDLTVGEGECLALVGESGSGKTTIARCVAGLHRPAGGRILLDGAELAASSRARTREQRRLVQMVAQNPYDTLNPRRTVGDAVSWPARTLRGVDRRGAADEAARLLELVRLPATRADAYPGELSGGERQRVAIARALAAAPRVLVCDEVTSALDVSVQAAVLDLLGELRRELGLAVLFITHDLGVVASIADRLVVLDRGRICEEGDVGAVLRAPRDGYTRRLLAAAPTLPSSTTASSAGLGALDADRSTT